MVNSTAPTNIKSSQIEAIQKNWCPGAAVIGAVNQYINVGTAAEIHVPPSLASSGPRKPLAASAASGL